MLLRAMITEGWCALVTRVAMVTRDAIVTRDTGRAVLATGTVALVCGTGPGLGRCLATTLARAGADVVLAARTAEALAPIADEVRALGRRALAVPTDVTVPAGAWQLASATEDAFGRLDVVVHNAFAMGPMTPATDGDLDGWRQAYEVNVIGALTVTTAVLPLLRCSPVPSIVVVGSQSARRSQPRRGAYAATKSAQLSLARTLAGELGPDGIRVNTVVPGHIWGAALEGFLGEVAIRRGTSVEDVTRSVAKEAALRRITTADEVADAVLFLASDQAASITGQSIVVDGGGVMAG